MSVQQKVGQLMMVGFGGTPWTTRRRDLVRGRQVGGVCMFKRNIADAEQVARLNDAVRALLADCDSPVHRGGPGGRQRRAHQRRRAGAARATWRWARPASSQLAYEAGRAQGEDLWRLGFNMNLAPVLDVNVNPRNPVIGIRAFGDRPELVADFGADFVRGQQEANIATVAKHFPGHGSVDADSHKVAAGAAPRPSASCSTQLAPLRRGDEGRASTG